MIADHPVQAVEVLDFDVFVLHGDQINFLKARKHTADGRVRRSIRTINESTAPDKAVLDGETIEQRHFLHVEPGRQAGDVQSCRSGFQ